MISVLQLQHWENRHLQEIVVVCAVVSSPDNGSLKRMTNIATGVTDLLTEVTLDQGFV